MSLSEILEEVGAVCDLCHNNTDEMDYIALKLDCCDISLSYYISNTSQHAQALQNLHRCINELQLYWNSKLNNSGSTEGRPKKTINIELVSHSH